MRTTIGIVSEGPTDFMVLKTVIDKITEKDNRYLSLQPEQDMNGRYGNGWKGVWRWCKEKGEKFPLYCNIPNEGCPVVLHVIVIITKQNIWLYMEKR